ncbi:hypothetical protein FXO38_22289 [Capsicum annuum]|nr:hypothetical protein FXO38_22289 [Capsicum annuum]KAF3677027.1 hypothetical protein FXO37_05041 [Capsicum annuum]
MRQVFNRGFEATNGAARVRALPPEEFCRHGFMLGKALEAAFSNGIGDTIVDASIMEKIDETISNEKRKVKELIKVAQEKQLEAEPGRTLMESFEKRVNQVLNKARDDAGSSAEKSLSESNNLIAMITAGSKGSFINIS